MILMHLWQREKQLVHNNMKNLLKPNISLKQKTIHLLTTEKWAFVILILIFGFAFFVLFKVFGWYDFLLILLALISLGMTLQASFTLWWMLYSWDHPEHSEKHKSPGVYIKPELSFTAIIPARNEKKSNWTNNYSGCKHRLS